MKKLLLLLGISFLYSSFTFAQESVGFSDPDDISPLLEYRLPDWGYSNFFSGLFFSRKHAESSIRQPVGNKFAGQVLGSPGTGLFPLPRIGTKNF